MRAVIPYKKENAKSRLSTVMTKEQRETFVEKMLLDVVATLRKGGILNIDIITPKACDVKKEVKANIIEDDTDLNDCLNEY
ncbi:MAG: 2-phospho-L-lactate guanylyltransferase, partial [Methanohalophilus sp. T328-1]